MRYTAGGRRLLREMQKYHFCRSRPPVLRDAGKRRLMKDEQEKAIELLREEVVPFHVIEIIIERQCLADCVHQHIHPIG